MYAVDIDRGFFPYIEQKANAAGVTNVQTVLGAPSDPRLPASNVDVAFFHDVLHHVEDRPGYLRNLIKYLEPSARIVVIDYHAARSPHREDPALQVSPAQAREWLGALGFTPVEEYETFDDKWFVVYRR